MGLIRWRVRLNKVYPDIKLSTGLLDPATPSPKFPIVPTSFGTFCHDIAILRRRQRSCQHDPRYRHRHDNPESLRGHYLHILYYPSSLNVPELCQTLHFPCRIALDHSTDYGIDLINQYRITQQNYHHVLHQIIGSDFNV